MPMQHLLISLLIAKVHIDLAKNELPLYELPVNELPYELP